MVSGAQGGECAQVAPGSAHAADAVADDAGGAAADRCVPSEPHAPQTAGVEPDAAERDQPSDSNAVPPDSRLESAAVAAQLRQIQKQRDTDTKPISLSAQPMQLLRTATPPAALPSEAEAAQLLPPWAAAQHEANVAEGAAPPPSTGSAATADSNAAIPASIPQRGGFSTPERSKPRSIAGQSFEAPAPAVALLTPEQQRAELQRKAQTRVWVAQAALQLAEATEPPAVEPPAASPLAVRLPAIGGEAGWRSCAPAAWGVAHSSLLGHAAARVQQHAASPAAAQQQLAPVLPQAVAAAATSSLGAGRDEPLASDEASAQATCRPAPASQLQEAAVAPATKAPSAAAQPAPLPHSILLATHDAAAGGGAVTQLRPAEAPAEALQSPKVKAAAVAACQPGAPDSSPALPPAAAAVAEVGDGAVAKAVATTPVAQHRHSGGTMLHLLAGEHWEETVLPGDVFKLTSSRTLASDP